jgi:DNA-nicking Smr family endonuclease
LPEPAAPPPVAPRPEAIPPPPAKRVLPPLSPTNSPGLDRRTGEKLKRGQLPIEAKLDLHGMTQAAARSALDRFIADAYRRGLRAILVITGKGLRAPPETDGFWEPQRPGVLRREVPRWLNEPINRPLVLAFTEAQPEHGGGGAFYLLLRRQRE